MAGAGSRFLQAGYKTPKYLIEWKGKTLLEYSLSSLPLEIAENVVFLVLESHILKYSITEKISKMLKSIRFEIIKIPQITRGQADTVLYAKEIINDDKDLVIYNIDTYFKSDTLIEFLTDKNKKYDGILGSFKGSGNKWSYASIDKNNFVTKTAEKKPISKNALTGLYHFTRGSDFVRIAEKHIKNGLKIKNEFYIAPMYNDLIAENKKFILDFVTEFIPLGTPEDLRKM